MQFLKQMEGEVSPSLWPPAGPVHPAYQCLVLQDRTVASSRPAPPLPARWLPPLPPLRGTPPQRPR